VDSEHIIRYMNPAGRKHYARFGDVTWPKAYLPVTMKTPSPALNKHLCTVASWRKRVLYPTMERYQVYMRACGTNRAT